MLLIIKPFMLRLAQHERLNSTASPPKPPFAKGGQGGFLRDAWQKNPYKCGLLRRKHPQGGLIPAYT